MSDWIERYHGSHPQKGWTIVGGGEEIVYLGESVSSEQVSKIIAAHNARVHDLSADNATAQTTGSAPDACELCNGVGKIGIPGQRCFACDGLGKSKFDAPPANAPVASVLTGEDILNIAYKHTWLREVEFKGGKTTEFARALQIIEFAHALLAASIGKEKS